MCDDPLDFANQCRPLMLACLLLYFAGRLVFHGTGFVQSYYTQKEETKPYIEWFIKDRFWKWLGYLESCLAQNNGGKG